jgi:hypothetical protein
MRAIIEPEGPPEPGAQRRPLATRLAWFCGLALAASAATIALAYALKLPLAALG